MSFEKWLFWEKYVQRISRRIAVAAPFMSDTSVTGNVAEKLGTTEQGAHMAMIGLASGLTGGVFRLALAPLAIVEMIKAYKKDGKRGLIEAGTWYFGASSIGTTAKQSAGAVIKTISRAVNRG